MKSTNPIPNHQSPIKAMILAAGKGTRLGTLGRTIPKILVPVGGVPLLLHTFAWLKNHGITKVAMNVNHLGDQIIELVGDGCRFGMEVTYSREDTLLGTAGGVKKMEHFFDDTFVVVYGDILTNFDLTAMVRFHKEKKAIATLALVEVSDPSCFGIVEPKADGKVIGFVEKPPPGTATSKTANAAVYVLETAVFAHIPADTFYDFGYDVFPKLLTAGRPIYGYRLTAEDYFMDVGCPEKHRQANNDMEAGRLGNKLQRFKNGTCLIP